MFELPPSSEFAIVASAEPMAIRPAIYLDYGVDAASYPDISCEVCDRGLRFQSRWQFDLGSIVNLAFAFDQATMEKVEVEGAVIDCHSSGDGYFSTTILFLEMQTGLRDSLSQIAKQ